jgi:hypothetical protein
MKITIKKYKPKTLGYTDSLGKYHGSYIVSGGGKFEPIITMSKLHAGQVAKARRKILRRVY